MRPLILGRAILPRQRASSLRAWTPAPPLGRFVRPQAHASVLVLRPDQAAVRSCPRNEMNTLAIQKGLHCSGKSAGPPHTCFEFPAQAADQSAVWACATR